MSQLGRVEWKQLNSTVGIRLPDMSGNRMVDMCTIANWSINWMAFSWRTKCPVTEWLLDIYGPYEPFGYRIFSSLTGP